MAAISPTTFANVFFVNENVKISIKVSLKFIPRDQINNISAFVQIIAWPLVGAKPLCEPMMVNLLTHICVTRLQWVHISSKNGGHSDKAMLVFHTWQYCSALSFIYHSLMPFVSPCGDIDLICYVNLSVLRRWWGTRRHMCNTLLIRTHYGWQ